MADQVTRTVLLEAKTKGVTEATKEYQDLAKAEGQATKMRNLSTSRRKPEKPLMIPLEVYKSSVLT